MIEILLSFSSIQLPPFSLFFPAVLIATLSKGPLAGGCALVLALIFEFWFRGVNPFGPIGGEGVGWLLVGAASACLVIFIADAYRRRLTHTLGKVARQQLLIREVHHRMKNSLQLVCSMISMQARGIPDETARERLLSLQDRVNAVARVHECIYESEDSEKVDISRCLEQVVPEFARSIGRDDAVKLNVQGSTIMNADRAMSLTLVLLELMTNAFKHTGPGGSVDVRCTVGPDTLTMTIADHGPGFPPGFEFETARTFGMRMIRLMILQLDGLIRVLPSTAGAMIEVRVPVRPKAHGASTHSRD